MTTQAFPKPKRLKKRRINLFKQESRSSIIKKLDKIVSDIVRNRDNWTCFYCHKQHEVGSKNLSNSHFWTRGAKSVRWDLDNCDSACWLPCHKYKLEGQKNGLYRDFKIKQLGQKRFDLLALKANTTTKYSTVDLSLMLSMYEKGVLK